MVQAIQELLLPAVLDRAVLVANHVLSGEPAAMQRLRAHAGRTVRVEAHGWPSLLPPWPPVELRLTGAGLLERVPPQGEPAARADLHLALDASNPAALAWGLALAQSPPVQVQGDAALAADVHWVATQVRWDIAADLERVVGAGPAQVLAGVASQFVQALRRAWPGMPGPRPATPPAGAAPREPGARSPDGPGGPEGPR